jgi:hypothetical protein
MNSSATKTPGRGEGDLHAELRRAPPREAVRRANGVQATAGDAVGRRREVDQRVAKRRSGKR